MLSSINFEKLNMQILRVFHVKIVGGSYRKNLVFINLRHRDYLVKWFEKDERWFLYFTHYDDVEFKNEFTKSLLIDVDTIFDVIDYICKNKSIHYT